MKHEQNRVFLGYLRNSAGIIAIHSLEAPVVNMIYHAYLNGNSPGKISDRLKEMGIHSPSGKPAWGRQVIDNLLSNEKYLGNNAYPQIISKELFDDVRQGKARRSSKEKQNAGNSRYSGAHPFSGLIICGECGRKYRRYTRSNGQVVLRCAEHGSEICKESPTIPEGRLRPL